MYKRRQRGLLILIAIAAMVTLVLHVSNSRATDSDPALSDIIARRQAAADSAGRQNALRQADRCGTVSHKREHKRRRASDKRQNRKPTPTRDPLSEPVPPIDSHQ